MGPLIDNVYREEVDAAKTANGCSELVILMRGEIDIRGAHVHTCLERKRQYHLVICFSDYFSAVSECNV